MNPGNDWSSLAMTTPTCGESFRKELSPALQDEVCSKYVRMAELFAASPRLLGEHFDRLNYLGADVYELDINEKWRSIVRVRDDALALYAVGDHNMILRHRFTPNDLKKADGEVLVPFTQVVCEDVLNAVNRRHRRQLDAALEPRWLYKLDESQSVIFDELAAPLVDPDVPSIKALVTGGPGTGKTSLVVQLADMFDWNPDVVALDCSDRLAQFLESSLGERVRRCRRSVLSVKGQSVVLVDDPATWRDVVRSFAVGEFRDARLVLVATDLAQVEDVVEDRALRIYLGGHRIRFYDMKRCYRQTKEVGAATVRFLRHISRRFTKHIRADGKADFRRRHRLSVETADALVFVQEGGYAKVYENASIADIRDELTTVLQQPLWSHWHPIALVLEPGIKGSKALTQHFPPDGAMI